MMLYLPNSKKCIGGDENAAGGNIPHVQLLNPAASGVVAYVTTIWVSNALNNVHLGRYDIAMTTLSAELINKAFGGAAPDCEVRFMDNNSRLGTQFAFFRRNSGDFHHIPFSQPIILAESQGLVVSAESNSTARVVFEWEEVTP